MIAGGVCEGLIAASRCKHETYTRKTRVFPEFGGTLGVLGHWTNSDLSTWVDKATHAGYLAP